MSGETYAVKIKTPRDSDLRFFCGFGKNKSVKTAWSLAGAKLFLNNEKLIAVLDQLKLKNKKYTVVRVAVAYDLVDLDVCQVYENSI